MRLDKYCEKDFSSRTKAAEAINRGEVLLNEKKAKPSDEVKETDRIEYLSAEESFVSNGGYKLARAIKTFTVNCNGKIFADVGASTGGFTDCLLQNGAQKVYCVDVGESLLDKKISADKRIVVMDNTNARFLKKEDFADDLDGVVIDVSFISLRLILPVLYNILPETGFVLALIKPQFECENKSLLSKNGILTDVKVRKKIIEKIYGSCIETGFSPMDIVNAPLKEKKNVEYVIYLQKGEEKPISLLQILEKSQRLI